VSTALWVVFWVPLYRSAAEHPKLSPGERSYIMSDPAFQQQVLNGDAIARLQFEHVTKGIAEYRAQQEAIEYTAAKAKVDSADPDDPRAFLATITDAENQLGQISAPDALADLSASPRLQKAAAKAANCQQLSSQGSDPPG